MLVRLKSTNQLGTIDDKDFDPTLFEKIVGEKSKSQNVLETIAKNIVEPFITTGKNIFAAGVQTPLMLGEAKAREAGNLDLALKLEKARKVVEPVGKSEQEFAAESEDKWGALAKQLGASMKIASYGVPIGGKTSLFGKAISASPFKGGAITGALYNAGEQVTRPVEQLSPAELGLSALTGGATASVLNRILSGGAKLKESGESINKAVLNPQAETSPFMFGQKQGIVDVAKKEGLWGKTPQFIEKRMNTLAEDIISKRDALALASKKTAPTKPIRKLVESVIERDSNTSTKLPIVKRWLDTLFKSEKLTGKDLVNINSAVTKVARSGAGDKAAAARVMKPIIDKAMDMIDDKIVPLNARLSGLYDVAEGTGIALKGKVGYFPVISTKIPARPFQWLGGKIGTGLEKAGVGMEKVTTPINALVNKGVMGQQPIKNIGALAIPLLSGGGQAPSEMPIDTTQTSAQPILSPQGQWRWDETVGDWVPNEQGANMPSLDEIRQMMLADLATGGKNIPELKTLYDTLAPTAEQKNRQAALKPASVIIDSVKKMDYSNSGPQNNLAKIQIERLGGLGVDPILVNLNQQFELMKQNVVRALQGARMSDTDIEMAKGYMPSITDTPTTIKTKLKNLEDFIKGLTTAT